MDMSMFGLTLAGKLHSQLQAYVREKLTSCLLVLIKPAVLSFPRPLIPCIIGTKMLTFATSTCRTFHPTKMFKNLPDLRLMVTRQPVNDSQEDRLCKS